MISSPQPLDLVASRPGRIGAGIIVGGVPSAVAAGLGVAYLVASGYWYIVLAGLLVLPASIVLHRYPLAVVTLWMLAVPLVGETESAALRKVFWLVHRAAPVAALVVIVLAGMFGIGSRKPARLGWAELMMGGYVVMTVLSIAYTSDTFFTTLFLLYDNVFIPMCLYLIIRLLEPDEQDLRRLLPVVAFVLLSQTVLGIISWRAPHVLPSEWLGKLGERTTGSLRAPEVFGTTLIFCGAFILHAALTARRSHLGRTLSVLLFALVLIMVFLSFSRSVWLAGLIALVGTVWVHRGLAKRLLLIVVPVMFLVAVSGLLGEQALYARQRFGSEESKESALSRLPVVYAAVRMFAARPLTGWGYDSFDRYDRQFQGRVANLVAPDEDHASHNLYLTILAEQGIVGFLLFGVPIVYWLFRTRSSMGRMPSDGLISRKLVATLWIVFAGFALVNNFYRMQTPFAMGMWWLTVGLIATLVARTGSSLDHGNVVRSLDAAPVRNEQR
jgi:O-antigen ligase